MQVLLIDLIQSSDRYESEAVRDRLRLVSNGIRCKKLNKAPRLLLQFSTTYIVRSFLSTEISWKDVFPVFHEQNCNSTAH